MSRLVLVIAAHADDEALGCGGAMARHASAGDRVETVFMTDGVGSRGEGAEDARARRAMAENAARILGSAPPVFGAFPDNAMDSVPLLAVAQFVEGFVAGRRPDVVYTHHLGDLNVDHRVTGAAVMTCFRPQPGRAAPTILSFEVASSTEWQAPTAAAPFVPNWFQDVGDVFDRKLAALDAYAREMREAPHPRSRESIAALAAWRGASCGLTRAEAFMLLRRIG
ncbi:MAG: PIG-L family deacetylase [Rhizobiales bacterium]|nr:PIG-L family deacetylase [Hyphomicrobiales bacterium]